MNHLRKKAETPNVSIIVTWNNRDELKLSLPSLIQAAHEVKGEITVVNFGGNRFHLQKQIQEYHEKIWVLDVEQKKFFNKPQAQNLGASVSSAAHLFFCDCDIKIPEGCLKSLYKKISAKPGYFGTINRVTETHVNSRKAKYIACFGYEMILRTVDQTEVRIIDNEEDASNGTRQAPGLLMVSRADFETVNGYNSQLDGWGWEDQDMICRLTLGGKLTRVSYGEVLHISHDDKARVQAFPYKDRWESRDRMFRKALDNYDNGNFNGTYLEDIKYEKTNRYQYVS